jgi:membrane fusion protein (multidrug efflux system)
MEQESIKNKKSNKLKLIIAGVVVLIGIIWGFIAWQNAQHHEATNNAQLDATIVSVRSAVSGFVKEVRFVDNQAVKKGDTLVIIDDKDYLAKVMQARALLKSAESQTGISKSTAQAAMQSASASSINSSALQSNINSAQAKATKSQKDLNRIEKMFNDGAATQQQLDAAKADNESATSLLELAKGQYQAALSQSSSIHSSAEAQEGQISVTTAIVQQRLAELELAESQLANCKIVAPFDGIVSKKNVEVGQLMQLGQPLCSAVEISELWVVANFKETQLNKIRIGQKVTVKLDAYENLELTGTVESMSGGTGAKFSLLPPDNATGNFVKVTQRIGVRIKLDKTDKKEYYLTPGLSASVDVEIK